MMTEYNDNFLWDDNDGYLRAGCLQVVGVVGTTIVAMLLCLLMESCTTTKYVPMPEYHNDTVRVTQYQRDSIYMHDSILVRQQGDTVTIDRWHTQYHDRWRTDTIYKSRVDSVPYKVEVIKEVPAKLSWWERLRLNISNVLLGVIALMIILFLIRRFAS